MSLVVAVKHEGVVYLGADTRTTRGERVRATVAEDDLKIHRLGDCLVGGAGSVASIQIMTSHPEWFDLRGKPLTKKYIVQRIIPKYYELVKELDKLENLDSDSDVPKCGCSFLMTDGAKIFRVDNDFEVIELLSYGQIGCTERIALTFLLNMPKGADPDEMILKALRNSAYRNDGVGAPYVLINSKDRRFKMVEV